MLILFLSVYFSYLLSIDALKRHLRTELGEYLALKFGYYHYENGWSLGDSAFLTL